MPIKTRWNWLPIDLEEKRHNGGGYRDHMEATGGSVTWEGFKTLFLNKYFPSNVKDQKEIEFLTLQQGDMTVDEYVARFESLALFSNNLQNQPDEAWKSKWFEQGHRPEVRNLVNSLWPRWRLADNFYGSVRGMKEVPKEERERKLITTREIS